MNQEFQKPPSTTNPSGQERTVGFEFEFTGMEMDEVASVISELYGGDIKQLSTYEFEIKDTVFGDFGLELDAQMIREKKYEKFLKNIGIDLSLYKGQETFENSLKELASAVVPYEIITPPFPLSSIHELTKLVNTLRRKKTKGTRSSIMYAFGLHINPDIPDGSAKSILNHLRAYVLLDSWIRNDADIDISRRLTPFINRFENDYIQHILNPGYHPTMQELIQDYFEFGNSRNRSLDLQPLFMYLNKDLTSALIQDKITSPRPTYHYRLPNCSIEDESWTLTAEWNRWVLVEKLAADEKTLHQYSQAYVKTKRETMMRFEAKWLELMDGWVHHVW